MQCTHTIRTTFALIAALALIAAFSSARASAAEWYGGCQANPYLPSATSCAQSAPSAKTTARTTKQHSHKASKQARKQQTRCSNPYTGAHLACR